MNQKSYWHVTPAMNEGSINSKGLDPDFSLGKMAVCWLVDDERLAWAIMHTSAKFRVPVDELICYKIMRTDFEAEYEYSFFAMRGVIYTPDTIRVGRPLDVFTALEHANGALESEIPF